MKKLFALILAICLSVTVLAALAEEDDFGYYPDEYPESQVFMSTWVAEDGDWRVEMYGEDGGIKPYIVHRLGDNKEDIWEYAVALDAEDHSRLTAVPFGLHYMQDTVSGEWDVTYYEDGDAVFTINENGCLVWTDLKEDAGKGLEFDEVLVAGADAAHYSEDYDRHLLYIACTRAMHRLVLSSVGTPSPFLPE